MLDGSYVFVDNVSPIANQINDKEGKKNAYIVSMSLIEVGPGGFGSLDFSQFSNSMLVTVI